MLKVSVVTISYNSKEQIKLTLEALKRQNYPLIESIIIDGGSTDGTIEVIKKFAKEFQGDVKWVSEKDNGIYHAINKGIKMATGDIIGFCWDLFSNDQVLSTMIKKIEKEHTDGVHGDLVYVGKDGEVIRYWKMGEGIIQRGWMPAHPTLYLKKEIFERYGGFDEQYRCSGDFEFMVRILKDHSVQLSYIPEVVVRMFYGGVSTSGWKAYFLSIKESYLALRRNRIRFPILVIGLRIVKTSKQFRGKRKNIGKIEKRKE